MENLLLNPKKILTDVGVSREARVADFGCGPGVFALPAAELTQGTVYCFDILASALEAVEGAAQMRSIQNIVTRRANLEALEGSGLDAESVDFVIMRKIILQNKDKNVLFAEACRILKPGGTLLIVGWTQAATIGPSPEQRITQDVVEELAAQAGFGAGKSVSADAGHYAVMFTKK